MNDLQKALNIAKNTTYLNDYYHYLRNVEIVEWDIHAAGLSALKYKKALPEKYLKELEGMSKQRRTVTEGLLQRKYKSLSELIIDTLAMARMDFVSQNNIPSDSILTIKKDALFLINFTPQISLIDKEFNFRRKNTYTSYINLNKKEFYYSSYDNSLDVKGLDSDVIEKQKDFLLKDIKGFLRSGEKVSDDVLFRLLKSYRKKYLLRQLPVETYRELNTGYFRCNEYYFETCSQGMLSEIDISQNYMNYLLPLFQEML